MTGKNVPTSLDLGNKTNLSDIKDLDQFLPIANVGRIMKKSLPPNAKISKEAKETVRECVSEFISFVTCEASDRCPREKRKTLNGDNLLWAMTTLGFENYVEPLNAYLSKYREGEGEKINSIGRQELGHGSNSSPTNYEENQNLENVSARFSGQVIFGKSNEF